jgi:hypothetical protein
MGEAVMEHNIDEYISEISVSEEPKEAMYSSISEKEESPRAPPLRVEKFGEVQFIPEAPLEKEYSYNNGKKGQTSLHI